jgi:predicted RNA-binding Zn ribbon-like protein
MMRRRNQLTRYAGGVTGGDDRLLELVIDFLNTMDVEEGTDELADQAAFRGWLRTHGLPERADLDAARRLRTLLRSAVGDRTAAGGPDTGESAGSRDVPAGIPVTVTLGPDGRPTLSAADPLGRIAAAAVRLADDGRWDRLKICTADDCRWAFYDRSKNRSRHWCSMGVCGNRAKSRSFRERQRAAGSGTGSGTRPAG